MFDKIIDGCRYVVEKSSHVKINYDNLDAYISKIDCCDIKNWLTNNPYNICDLGVEKFINFLLLFSAINYSFWGYDKWTINDCGVKKDGSDALLYLLLKYVKKTDNFDFSKVSYIEFSKLLEGNIEIPLLRERYDTLVDISLVVNSKMNGNFYKYIYDVVDDSKLFEIIISNFKCFTDERKYKNRTIYFYKLAQLLVSDILHVREYLEKIDVCYSNLVGCSDYKIPQVMRELNILEYDSYLAHKVDNKVEIEVGSLEECEIRASMIIVIDYISTKINYCKIDINDYFFLLSRKIKSNNPYHLCRCTNY